MRTTTVVVITGIVLVAGRWAEGKELTDSFGVGAFVTLLGVSVLNSMSETLGLAFAVLLLITSLLRYGLSILRGIGWTTA